MSAGAKAGDAFIEIKGDDRQFRKTLQSIEGQFRAFGATIAKVGAGLAAVGAGIGAGIGVSIKKAADFEQVGVAFETFLGSAEKARDVLEQLNQFSLVTPFTPDQVNQAGKALLAFGVSSEDLVPTLQTVGDLAAGTGKDFNELAIIFGKAKVAGTLFAEDINQLTEAGIPIIDEFAKQLGVSAGEVKKLGSEGKISFANLQKAFVDLTSDGGKFAGLMANQSKTLGGLFSTLEGFIGVTLREIGNAFLPIAKDVVKAVIPIVDGIRKWVIANKEVVVAVGAVAAVLAVVGSALVAFGVGLAVLGPILAGIGTAVGVLGSVLAALVSPIGIALAAFAALVAGGAYLIASFTEVGSMISQTFDFLAGQIGEAIKVAVGALLAGDLEAAAEVLWASLNLIWVSGVGVLKSVWVDLKAAFFEVVDAILDKWNGAVNFIAEGALRIQGLFDSSLDVEAAVAALEGPESNIAGETRAEGGEALARDLFDAQVQFQEALKKAAKAAKGELGEGGEKAGEGVESAGDRFAKFAEKAQADFDKIALPGGAGTGRKKAQEPDLETSVGVLGQFGGAGAQELVGGVGPEVTRQLELQRQKTEETNRILDEIAKNTKQRAALLAE